MSVAPKATATSFGVSGVHSLSGSSLLSPLSETRKRALWIL